MEKKLGIVFTGGEGPQTLRGLFGDLTSSGILLVAADSGLMLAEQAGLKPDWIIGDMDSLDDPARLNAYPAERIILHETDKDHTDTELALALLWEKGCDEAWIIGGGGGRLTHLLGIRDLFERERFPRRWITAAEDIYCIEQGKTLTLPLEPGVVLSAFPIGGGPWKAKSTGLKWALDNVHWKRGLYGLSNIALAPEITVSVKQGRFLIIVENVCQQ